MKGRLLVVDDEPSILAAFSRYFGDLGYAVTPVSSAEEALAAAKREPFDFIFLDNVLPGMSGLRAIPELSRRSRAPILMMTAHFDEELKKDALLLGAADFLPKPLDFEALARRLATPTSGA
ncbi:MAG: response regulator [Elusimicrobia bacterium]|nr:response regulator [Elusimicrobiota bacterium]